MAPNTTKGAYDSTPADTLWEEFSQYLCRAIDTMNSMLEGLHTPSPFSVGHEAYKAEKERQDSFVQGQLSIARQDFQSAKGCLAQLRPLWPDKAKALQRLEGAVDGFVTCTLISSDNLHLLALEDVSPKGISRVRESIERLKRQEKKANEALSASLALLGREITWDESSVNPPATPQQETMSRPAPVVPSITPEQAAALRKLTEEKFVPEMMKAQALVMEMAAASLNPAQSGYIRRRSHYLILLVVVVVSILAVLVGTFLLFKGFSTGAPTALPAAGPPPPRMPTVILSSPGVAPTSPPSVPDPDMPSPGWTHYSNADMGFSASVPDGWAYTDYPVSQENPWPTVSFGASQESTSPDATVITVVAIPMSEVTDKGALDASELRRVAQEWVKQFELQEVRPMQNTQIEGHPAVVVVHEADSSDKSFRLRGHTLIVATSMTLYFIHAVGVASYADTIENYFQTFTAIFKLLPQAATLSPTATSPSRTFSTPRAPVPTSSPQATRQSIERIPSGRMQGGFRVGTLEWKPLGYILVDYARQMEVQMMFHSQGARASAALDFRLVADGQEFLPTSVRVTDPDVPMRMYSAPSVREASRVELVGQDKYLLAIVTFNTPVSCMSTETEKDACMRNKATSIRWLPYGMTEKIQLGTN